jgi:hypothetical protein
MRLAPERNREHSIRDQVVTLNVGFMERLQTNYTLSIPDNSIIVFSCPKLEPLSDHSTLLIQGRESTHTLPQPQW